MARSNIAGTRSRTRAAACALIFTLGPVGASHAAQMTFLTTKYVAKQAFAGHPDSRAAAVTDQQDPDDCEPAPLSPSVRSGYLMVMAKADMNSQGSRAARIQKAGGARHSTGEAGALLAPPAPATPVLAAGASRDWEIMVADKTLNATLARWAAAAGWQLIWELPVDYAVEARTRVNGTFEEAVGVVADSMESAEIPMKAVFYQGNKVLRIMAKGAE